MKLNKDELYLQILFFNLFYSRFIKQWVIKRLKYFFVYSRQPFFKTEASQVFWVCFCFCFFFFLLKLHSMKGLGNMCELMYSSYK